MGRLIAKPDRGSPLRCCPPGLSTPSGACGSTDLDGTGSPAPAPLAPTHSHYALGSAFLEGSHVTASDLDTVSASVPTPDVARFVSKMKCVGFSGGLEKPAAAGSGSAAFMDEYPNAG